MGYNKQTALNNLYRRVLIYFTGVSKINEEFILEDIFIIKMCFKPISYYLNNPKMSK
jgi:hypothetical protein